MGQNIVGGFSLDADLPAGRDLKLQIWRNSAGREFLSGEPAHGKTDLQVYFGRGSPIHCGRTLRFFGYRYVNVLGWPVVTGRLCWRNIRVPLSILIWTGPDTLKLQIQRLTS
jgi:hypothetical protein